MNICKPPFVVLSLVLTLGSTACFAADESRSFEQRREKSAVRAIEWLVETTRQPSWSKTNPSMANAAAKKQVVDLLTAWLLLLYDDVDSFEPVRDELLSQAEQGIDKPSASRIGFSNWLDGFAALYLTERSLRDGKPHPSLERVARKFVDRQNAEGGWSHSGGSLGDFYPTTLISASNLALLSLGGARHFELEVTNSFDYKDAVAEAVQLYRDVQAPSGVLPYGGRPYRKGFESGRTSWALLGLAALGESDGPLFQRAAAHVRRNVDKVPYGHASPAIHVGLGGLSLRMLGEEPWAEYQKKVLTKLIKFQTKEGWFRDFAGKSPDSMKLMGDGPEAGAYRTALYALALSADRSQLVRTLAKKISLAETVTVGVEACIELEPCAVLPVPSVLKVAIHGDHAVALASDGGLYPIDLQANRVLDRFHAGLTKETALQARLFLTGTDVLVGVTQQSETQAPQSLRDVLSTTETPQGCELLCIDILTGKKRWRVKTRSLIRAASVGRTTFDAIQYDGCLVKYAISDGAVIADLRLVRAIVNIGYVTLEDGRFASSGESQLRLFDRSGDTVWTNRTRAKRGVTPPGVGALAAAGNHLYAGSTDGLVRCLTADKGSTAWQVDLGGAVMQLLIPKGHEDIVVAACGDGRMHGIREGQIVWSLDVARGREAIGNNQVRPPFSAGLVNAGVLIDSPKDQQLQLVDPATGIVKSYIPCRGAWSARGDYAAVVAPDAVHVFEPGE